MWNCLSITSDKQNYNYCNIHNNNHCIWNHNLILIVLLSVKSLRAYPRTYNTRLFKLIHCSNCACILPIWHVFVDYTSAKSENLLWHCSHSWDLILMWVIMCPVSSSLRPNFCGTFHTRASWSLFVCVTMCLFRFDLQENLLWHSLHSWWFTTWALTLVWVIMCLVRPSLSPNFLWHTSHSCLLIFVCVTMCLCRLRFSENFVWHCSHSWALTLVWVIMCPVSSSLRPLFLWHTSHSCLLIFECVTMCLCRFSFSENLLWYCSHSWALTLVWVSKCPVSLSLRPNFLWHTSHSCFLIFECVAMCLCRFPFSENLVWYCSHSWALTLVWVSMCLVSPFLCPNFLWHTSHSCLLIFKCVTMCPCRPDLQENLLWHSLHSWCFTTSWRWLTRSCLRFLSPISLPWWSLMYPLPRVRHFYYLCRLETMMSTSLMVLFFIIRLTQFCHLSTVMGNKHV